MLANLSVQLFSLAVEVDLESFKLYIDFFHHWDLS